MIIVQLDSEQLSILVQNAVRKAMCESTVTNTTQNKSDRWLTLTELCEYHPDKPAKPTVYGWVSGSTIPNHKSGRKLRFLRSEIDSWLLNGKNKTGKEIANDADTFLSNRNTKGRLHPNNQRPKLYPQS